MCHRGASCDGYQGVKGTMVLEIKRGNGGLGRAVHMRVLAQVAMQVLCCLW